MLMANAQSAISGKIIDEKNEPIMMASVAILNAKDSTLITGTTADENGFFKIENLKRDFYLIKISSLGYQTKFIKTRVNNGENPLGNLSLTIATKELKTVQVNGQIVAAKQKNDTTEYSANAFKVNQDANAEDLINKMPTMQQNNGKLQAQGEDVKKVLVDGKPFFGDDPNAALKNLPAEAIDKIQVFDAQSDQSAFSGFNDGNTSKTINITIKPQFKDGWFGRFSAGYGYKNVWMGKANVNYYKGNRKLSILLNANNINEQNFGIEDLLGVVGTNASNSRGGGMSGGGGRGRGGGQNGPHPPSEVSDFLVANNNGITTTYAAGINYGDKWKKADINLSYFFNYGNTNALTNINRVFFANSSTDATLSYKQNSNSNAINQNHRFSGRFDWKIDSSNSFLIVPRLSVQLNKGNSLDAGDNYSANTIYSTLNNLTHSNLSAINASLQLLYRHAMQKKGRSFTLGFTPSYANNNGNNDLDYKVSNINDSTLSYSYFQTGNIFSNYVKLSGDIGFTEPFKTKGQWLFTESLSWSKNLSDKLYKKESNTTPIYTDKNLSNKFESELLTQKIGTQFQHTEKKWNIAAGADLQGDILFNQQFFANRLVTKKTFLSILPNARFQYNFAQGTQLRIFYRTNANLPTITQLQNVVNNSNPLFLSSGNPNLKRAYENNLNIRFSTSNTKKNTSFFIYAGASHVYNYIATATTIVYTDTTLPNGIQLASGAQYSTYENLKNYWNARAFTDYSFRVNPIKSRINIGGGFFYNYTPSRINSLINISHNTNVRFNVGLSSNISERYDFSIRNSAAVNITRNTSTTSANSIYFNNNLTAKAQLNPWKGLVLMTDFSYQYNLGLSSSVNSSYILWNAAIGYKFLKDKSLDIRLFVYDILNQNNNVSRTNTDIYYEDTQSNIINRYFMLQVSFNLRYFPAAKKINNK